MSYQIQEIVNVPQELVQSTPATTLAVENKTILVIINSFLGVARP